MTTIPGYDPTQAENMLKAARIVLSGAFWMLPCEVVKFDRDEGCVDLRPVIRDRDENGEVFDLPDVVCAPVIWPFLGGGWSSVFDIAEGDIGLGLFSSRSMSSWVSTGSKKADPEGSRQGSLSDGVFIAGIRSLDDPPAALATEGLHIGKDDGAARLSISPLNQVILKGLEVLLGSETATDFVALASLVATELGKISTATGLLAAGLGGAPIANPYPTPGAVAATKVKAI